MLLHDAKLLMANPLRLILVKIQMICYVRAPRTTILTLRGGL
jgi:hypothetical protein